jgi:subtilisin family serine protease
MPPLDALRRRLRLLACALALAAFAPAIASLPANPAPGGAAALADDDDDDDDDDGDDDDDRPRRRPAARAAPEIVVSVPLAADLQRVVGRGFSVLARAESPLLGGVVARLRGRPGESAAGARNRLRALLPAAVLDDNHLYRPNAFACDETGCDAFEMVGWSPSGATCPAAVPIGIVDTAVDPAHPALAGAAIERLAVLGPDRRPAAATHGTAVAALIAGRPDGPAPGLLPGAPLLVAEAFHRGAAGDDTADAFDIARALDALVERGAAVINLSFAGPANAVLERAVAAVRARDVAMVAAAGNGGPRAAPLYPAAYPGVVAVTAVDRAGEVYRRANTGPHIDLAAPGVRLWTAGSGGRPGTLRSGTSFAAPFVTASLAALRGAAPEVGISRLLERLAATAEDRGAPGRDAVYGWGILRTPRCGG